MKQQSLSIYYFAWVREQIGADKEALALTDDLNCVSDVLEYLTKKSNAHQQALSEPKNLRFAVDHEFANLETLIKNARELAIFPPVTGG